MFDRLRKIAEEKGMSLDGGDLNLTVMETEAGKATVHLSDVNLKDLKGDHPWASLALKTGWFRCDHVEGELASGRKFTYEMDDFRFPVNATKADAKKFAERVIHSKYVFCEWDRDHPEENQRAEISEFIEALVLHCVATAQELK